MEYKFTTKVFGQEEIYGIEFDSLSGEEQALFEINSHAWNSNKIQDILGEIQALKGEENYDYQVEDGNLGISIYTDEVYFFNLTNRKEEEEFIWTTEKFVFFLKEFQQFLKDNRR
ncbi:hypothetical protein [uncultured Dokdonia sp.]|uniref:hypothetical protein n=1 Tax=uncultured Dokdonia sp. TaxID=575653 RepID=UPI002623028E|nr:hypothetical protein [uncultured Dokdonia sp.]